MPSFLQKIIDKTFYTISTWPQLDGWTAIGLACGFAGLIFSVISIIQSKKRGEQSLNLALERLINIIQQRLDSNHELVTANGIRSLGISIQQSLGSPVFTNSLYASTIRQLALQLEQSSKGKKLSKKIQILNEVLKDFDPKGPPLMSIASEDPLFAYALSGISLSIGIFYAQVWATRLFPFKNWENIFFGIFPILQIFIMLSAIRASRFWKRSSAGLIQDSRKKISLLLDFFLFQTISNKTSIHVSWSPLSETITFGVIPFASVTIIPLIMYNISGIMAIDHNIVTSFLRQSILVLYILAIIFIPYYFAQFHRRKYFQIRKLIKKLTILERNCELVRLGHLKSNCDFQQEILAIRKKLWMLTGNVSYIKGISNLLANPNDQL